MRPVTPTPAASGAAILPARPVTWAVAARDHRCLIETRRRASIWEPPDPQLAFGLRIAEGAAYFPARFVRSARNCGEPADIPTLATRRCEGHA